MNILFFHAGIGYGGASKMIVDVANHLSQTCNTTILTFRSNIEEQHLKKEVKHEFNTFSDSKIKPIQIIKQIQGLHNYLKDNKIDLVVAFLHPANYISVLSAMGTNTKVLLSERGDPISRSSNGGLFVHSIEKIIQMADYYVFQSEGAQKAYPMRCQKKGKIIVNAIPDVNYPDYQPKEDRIVCVARLEIIQKRQDILIKAFKIFSETHPTYTLSLLGTGPDKDRIESLIQKEGLQDRVHLLGAINNVFEYVSESKCFVLSSDYEGLPNALLEAMVIGIPCISTDCSPGGARMIIEDGVNGFLVKPGDYEELAKKMSLIIDDKNIREAFTSLSKTSVKQKFNHVEVYKQWSDYISQIEAENDNTH